MNEENEDLITQSEAARLTGTSPSNISDKIKRGRYKVRVISGNRFLSKKEVLGLEKRKGGRPLKSAPMKTMKQLKELNDLFGKIRSPERFYPHNYSILLELRKENSDDSLPLLWKNLWWRRNRIKLRNSLKSHNKIWETYVCCDKIYVRRKFEESIIENFYNFCLFSEKIYQRHFSIAALKRDFLLNSEFLLNMKPDKERVIKRTAEIFTLFAEGIELNLSSAKSALRVVNLLLQSEKNLTIPEKRAEASRILRTLYESNRINSKSIDRITSQIKTEKKQNPSKI